MHKIFEVVSLRLGAIVVWVVDLTVRAVEPVSSLLDALSALAATLESHTGIAYLVVKNERRVTSRNRRSLRLYLWRYVYVLLDVFDPC